MALTPARANDGYVSFGGSPNLMRRHPQVTMQSEVVRLTVGEKHTDVHCRFVFRNQGAACVVRMGFPEELHGANETADNEREAEGKPPSSSFASFRSTVSGRPARTRLLRGRHATLWHVKDVRFPAHATVTVDDYYRQEVGGQIVTATHLVYQAGYLLHTGGSWHGPIGSTELVVTFQRRGMGKLHPLPMRPSHSANPQDDAGGWEQGWRGDPGRIYYRAFARPTVRGQQLRFVRRNWRPTRRDNVHLVFSCQQYP